MEKKEALIFALIFTFLIANTLYFFNIIEEEEIELEKVILKRAVDGDTLELEDGRVVRMLNINTPEKKENYYEEAKDFTKNFENKTLSFLFLGKDKYNRDLAKVYYQDTYLNLELVNDGLAVKFLVEDSEKELFDNTENKAVKSSLGLWKKSDFFGCLDSEVKPSEEILIIKNKCDSLDLSGWLLRDESRKKYIFKQIQLENNGMMKIKSGKNEDKSADIFWNIGDVWNNDRDTIYILDKNGLLVHHKSYGY